MIRPRARSSFAALTFAAMLLAACGAARSPAAVIGDTEISDERLETEVALFRFLTGLSGAPCGSPIDGESEQSACARFTLTNVIQEELVIAYAAGRDVAVDDAEVADAIGQLEESLGGGTELTERLRAEGLSRNQLDAIASRLLLFGEVQQLIVDELVDDGALHEAYDEQIGQFTTVEVRHILLGTQQEAVDVATRANPDNFARLARERSTDPGSAQNGGNLGSYSESQFMAQFDANFAEAALALEPGQISGPVETQFGWHVIQLVRRDVAAFEDVREQLVAQEGGAAFDEWLRERYRAVHVEVNPRYGRLDLDTGEVVPVRSTADAPNTPSANDGSPSPADS